MRADLKLRYDTTKRGLEGVCTLGVPAGSGHRGSPPSGRRQPQRLEVSGLQAGDVCDQEPFFHRHSEFQLSLTLEGGAHMSWHVLSVCCASLLHMGKELGLCPASAASCPLWCGSRALSVRTGAPLLPLWAGRCFGSSR